MNIKSIIFEEYDVFEKKDAESAIEDAKETVKDIKNMKNEEEHYSAGYSRVAREDLFDLCISALKFEEYNTKETKELMKSLKDFIERNGGKAELKVQLEI